MDGTPSYGTALKHADVTGLILKAFYEVYNYLGCGFLEKVYGNALRIIGKNLGLEVVPQVPIRVFCGDAVIGEYVADCIVNNVVLVELKAAKRTLEEHEAQLLNYLKATPFEVGLLLNFGPQPQYRRKILENSRKGRLLWLSRERDPNL